MPCGCLFVIFSTAFPRAALVLLFLFNRPWLMNPYEGIVIPLLGLLFLPYTLLWTTYVFNVHAGEWGLWQILILVLAVLFDLSPLTGRRLSRKRHRSED
jgi:hypothetical protein